MIDIFKKFAVSESGATAIEYALLAALIGVGIISGATQLRQGLDTSYTGVGDAVGDAMSDAE